MCVVRASVPVGALPSEAPSLRAGVWACRLSRLLVAVAFVCLRASRLCHVLVDLTLIHVVRAYNNETM